MPDYLYPRKLQESFEYALVSGKLEIGQIIRVDDVANQFDAESSSAKQILSAAYRKGLVEKQAEGQYRIIGKSKPEITSVFQHADKSGLKPKSIVRAVTLVPADEIVAKKLMVSVGDLVFRQTRTRLINDQVVANQYNFIPIEVCPGLEEVDLTRKSFQVTLEKRFHTVVVNIEENFTFAPGTLEDLEILGLSVGAKVLVVQRLSSSSSNMPLVWADIHVCTEHYHYVKALWPQAAGLLVED